MTFSSDREAQRSSSWLFGVPRSLIAKRLGLSEYELAQLYGRALETAGPEADAMVAGGLIRAALGGHLGAICFVSKVRAGWSETAYREEVGSRTQATDLSPDKVRRALALAGVRSVLEKLLAEASRRRLDLNFERPKGMKSKLMAMFGQLPKTED